MNAISFKNFRKFEEFSTLALGGVTYLVGGNNAGKSTVVKAMRLLLANLKSMQTVGTGILNRKPVFYYDNPKDIHIGTFVKALRHGAERKSMTIQGELAQLNIKLEISQADEQSAYGLIDNIQLKNVKEGYILIFDVNGNKASITKPGELSTIEKTEISEKSDNSELLSQLKYLLSRQKEVTEAIADTTKEMQRIEKEIAPLRKELSKWENANSRSMVTDQDGEITFFADYPDGTIVTLGTPEDEQRCYGEYRPRIQTLEMQKDTLQKSIDMLRSQSNEYIMQIADVNSKIKAVKTAQDSTPKIASEGNTIEVPLSMSINYEGENIICQYINGMIMTLSTEKRIANPAAVQLLRQIREQFEEVLRGNNIEYVPAHAATQQTIFRISDENDNMAQLVHAWSRQQINSGDEEHQFIIRWMKSLGIGENFKVRPLEGEAYAVDIYEHNSDITPATLSELGMGAIQAMTLLFRLSSIMRQYKERTNKPLIMIEEPEQNMHPNWQSLLAEIFEEVHNQGFRLLVETHSEYLIRKSQLQVAAMKFVDQADLDENCPISTWYFPDKEAPYAMQYAIQGNFYKPFGTGFFDEADNLATRLML